MTEASSAFTAACHAPFTQYFNEYVSICASKLDVTGGYSDFVCKLLCRGCSLLACYSQQALNSTILFLLVKPFGTWEVVGGPCGVVCNLDMVQVPT